MEIGGGTRVFALLGNPVAHSLSPVMQNAAFRALGLDAVYVPLRCEADAVGSLMRGLALAGGGGNVTIPYKETAARVVAPPHLPGKAICNTFWAMDGKLVGAETDSAGILAALRELEAPEGPWLLIGSGGSALAALGAAGHARVRIAVHSRSPERASRFLATALALGVQAVAAADCRVAINCTPLGLKDDDPLPLSPDEAPGITVALDLVYRRGETPWVRAMRAANQRAADGRAVLLEQGAAAFELWFPDKSAPREVMRAAVLSALE